MNQEYAHFSIDDTTVPTTTTLSPFINNVCFVLFFFFCLQTHVHKTTSNSIAIQMSLLKPAATYCAKVRSQTYITPYWKIITDWSNWSPEACWETGAEKGKESLRSAESTCWSFTIFHNEHCHCCMCPRGLNKNERQTSHFLFHS